ncbi:hypothetical protein AVEN_93185-1, partial [Araneus ventricosus]
RRRRSSSTTSASSVVSSNPALQTKIFDDNTPCKISFSPSGRKPPSSSPAAESK